MLVFRSTYDRDVLALEAELDKKTSDIIGLKSELRQAKRLYDVSVAKLETTEAFLEGAKNELRKTRAEADAEIKKLIERCESKDRRIEAINNQSVNESSSLEEKIEASARQIVELKSIIKHKDSAIIDAQNKSDQNHRLLAEARKKLEEVTSRFTRGDGHIEPEVVSSIPAGRELLIYYRNHRGDTSWRVIVPFGYWYGMTEHHKDEQHFLKGYCTSKLSVRDFAVKDIIAQVNVRVNGDAAKVADKFHAIEVGTYTKIAASCLVTLDEIRKALNSGRGVINANERDSIANIAIDAMREITGSFNSVAALSTAKIGITT